MNVEKCFLWRACHDLLPTRVNLFKRKVITDPSCLFCGVAAKTGFHVLWDYPSAKDVWSMAGGVLQKSHYYGPEFLQVVEGIFRKCGQEDCAIFAGLARRIWVKCNEVLHRGQFTQPSVIIQLVHKSREEFRLARENDKVPNSESSSPASVGWMAPALGWVKVNWDAALDSKSRRMGYEVVIRDHHGIVRAARSFPQRGLLTPAAAEAQAAIIAIRLCKEGGFTWIHLEGDAKGVVEAVMVTHQIIVD